MVWKKIELNNLTSEKLRRQRHFHFRCQMLNFLLSADAYFSNFMIVFIMFNQNHGYLDKRYFVGILILLFNMLQKIKKDKKKLNYAELMFWFVPSVKALVSFYPWISQQFDQTFNNFIVTHLSSLYFLFLFYSFCVLNLIFKFEIE